MTMAVVARRWAWVPLVMGLLLAACGGSGGKSSTPRASVETGTPTESSIANSTSTTTTTVPAPLFEPRPADPNLTPEEQVEAAYLFYWEVVTDAFARGDTTYLPLVLTGGAVDTRSAEVNRFVTDEQRYIFKIEHDYDILLTQPDEAVIADLQQSRFETVDAHTGEILDAEMNTDVPWVYWLVMKEGTWYVDGFHIEGQPLQDS